MSGLRPIAKIEFDRALRARGASTEAFAAELDVSGSVVRKLLANTKPRRGPVWKALLGLLTEREKELLVRVEQDATWNKRQLGKRPIWTAEKASAIDVHRQQRKAEFVA